RLRRGERVHDVETTIRHRSGAMREISASVDMLEGDDGRGVLVFVSRDITERKATESRLRRLNRALQTLSAGVEAVVRAASEVTLGAEICRILVAIGGHRLTWIGRAEHDTTCSITPVARAGYDHGF